MMDIKRRVSTRIAPRSGAIAYGIEGSKVVLATLERTKSEEDIAFLKPVADNATTILSTMRGIREGEIDDEFASLALDACGLAFLLIHECYRFRGENDQIPDRLKWGSEELAEYLRGDIHPFVQKKINRGFVKKHLMQGSDGDKITKFREKLRSWMVKLGIQTELSIHEKVEEIISAKMATQARVFNEIAKSSDRSESRFTEPLQGSVSNSAPLPLGNRSPGKPFPQIIVSDSRDDGGEKGQTEELDSTYDKKPDRPKPDSSVVEDLDRQKSKRKEEERLAKKAERERWRRSEREFRLLPLQDTAAVIGRPESPARPASVASFRSQACSLESAQSSAMAHLPSILKHAPTDHELALQLQAQLAKEIEEEDERKALEIGIALHGQWQAEERARSSDERRLGSNVQPQESMDSKSHNPTETGDALSRIQTNQLQSAPPEAKTDINHSAPPIQIVEPHGAVTQSRLRT